jgi:hypothetical protein
VPIRERSRSSAIPVRERYVQAVPRRCPAASRCLQPAPHVAGASGAFSVALRIRRHASQIEPLDEADVLLGISRAGSRSDRPGSPFAASWPDQRVDAVRPIADLLLDHVSVAVPGSFRNLYAVAARTPVRAAPRHLGHDGG